MGLLGFLHGEFPTKALIFERRFYMDDSHHFNYPSLTQSGH